MAERACDLMMAVEERLQALERVTRDTDAAQWVRVCTAEGWPVALVAYHVARVRPGRVVHRRDSERERAAPLRLG